MTRRTGCNQYQHKCGGGPGSHVTKAASALVGVPSGRVERSDGADSAHAPAEPPAEDEFADAMARAQADADVWAHVLATEPDPLRRELAQIGIAGLDRRYGLDHHDFEARFSTLDALEALNVPPGMPPVPRPSAAAGQISSVVVKRAPNGAPWNVVQGLALRWHGEGDETARNAYTYAIGGWFLALFAAINRTMPPHGL